MSVLGLVNRCLLVALVGLALLGPVGLVAGLVPLHDHLRARRRMSAR